MLPAGLTAGKRTGAAVANVKIAVEFDYTFKYSGAYKNQVDGKPFRLPVFKYDKSVKVAADDLDPEDVRKEFYLAAKGLLGTIHHIVEGVLKENRIDPKDRKPDGALVSKTQKQLDKELAPISRTLTKLLEATIDELGGNEPDDKFDPEGDGTVKKYLETLAKVEDVCDVFADLEKAREALIDQATELHKARQDSGIADRNDKEWLKLITSVEEGFSAFEKALQPVQKRMKAKAPPIQAPKKGAKESAEDTKQREALTELVELLGKTPKRLDAISAVIAQAGQAKVRMVNLLKLGRDNFSASDCPEVPDVDADWDALNKHLAAIEKAAKAVGLKT